jgi:predicted phosphodiesterase
MRYGVIADIHSNLHALEAALEMLSDAGVDEYLCAGDLVGYGPMPNECVARIAELDPKCVAGNHDLIAIGELADDGISTLARTTLEWTKRELSDESRAFIEGLPPVAVTADGVVVAHGSLADPSEYVREPGQEQAQLHELERSYPDAKALVLGHTHLQVAHADGGGRVGLRDRPLPLDGAERYLLNPGSVGQSRQRSARARFMVLGADDRRATFFETRYDVRGCRDALRERGLPAWAHHPTRSPWGQRAAALGDRLSRTRSRTSSR